jgi:hypothetical protein
MLPFLRSRRSLYVWALAGLTDVAVATPLLLIGYSALSNEQLPSVLPGSWLLMLIYALASAWEAGNRGEQAQSPARRSVTMLVGMLVSYVLAYLLLPAGMKTGLLAWNAAVGMLPVAGYLWYQGTLAAASGVEYGRLFDRFPRQVVGMVAAILLLIMTGVARDPRVSVMLWWAVVLLFAAGLVSLVVAREAQLRQGQAREGDLDEGSRSQSPVVTVALLAMVALTLGASTIMGLDQLSTIGQAIFGVYERLVDVVMLVVWRWVILLTMVLEPFFRWLYRNYKPQAQESQDGELFGDEPPQSEPLISGESVENTLRILLVIAVLVGAMVAIYMANTRVRKRAEADEEERESLGFWQNLLGDLKGLLQRDGAPAPAAAAPSEVLAPGDLRHLLRRLQVWGAFRAGRPRQPEETPNAYGAALAERKPERQAEVASVTAVYNQVRYGGALPAPERVQRATAAMAELEREPAEK